MELILFITHTLYAYMGHPMQKKAFEHAQNVQIHIILHISNVSFGHFSSLKHSIIFNDSVCGQQMP